MKALARLRTYMRLGLGNITRVAVYRLALKSGRHPAQRLAAPVVNAPFFRRGEGGEKVPEANTTWRDALWWFGWHRQSYSEDPPNWLANPFSDAPQPDASQDWWQISDFGAGDIKGLWELSRFDWVVAWSTMVARHDAAALRRLNHWLADWAVANPPYKGPNWKCGQEASIRVMHLATAAWVLGQDRAPETGLVGLLVTHLQRIAPTMSYAIGQQNNHGTSEAAALFIGGSLLSGHDPRAEDWASKGRNCLEERAATLIAADGSFSQHSVNYHRLMLDTYALAEAWRRYRGLPRFSARLSTRLAAATRWLWTMVNAETGDAPHLGANDGARILQLTDSDYRDFRPSVQLAAALFEDLDAYGPGPWVRPLRWLGVPDGSSSAAPSSQSFDDGGYHVLRRGDAMAILRYPRFRFRPSQADALHVDLWHGGRNLLRDAGTFSYNDSRAEWFASTAAHNTIAFDGRDQMPRLGRFLFGDWLQAEDVQTFRETPDGVSAAAAYTDSHGARHQRVITLTAEGLTCQDTVSGSFEEACLRWRLMPGDWKMVGTELRNGRYRMSISIDGEPVTPSLQTTQESRYYLDQSELPLVSVKASRPRSLLTKVAF